MTGSVKFPKLWPPSAVALKLNQLNFLLVGHDTLSKCSLICVASVPLWGHVCVRSCGVFIVIFYVLVCVFVRVFYVLVCVYCARACACVYVCFLCVYLGVDSYHSNKDIRIMMSPSGKIECN